MDNEYKVGFDEAGAWASQERGNWDCTMHWLNSSESMQEQIAAKVIRQQADRIAALEAEKAERERQEPVAVIGPVWQLLYVGGEPIAEIAKRFGLKIGSALYAHPLAIREPSDEECAAIYRNYVCPPVPCEEVSSDVELGRLMFAAVRSVTK